MYELPLSSNAPQEAGGGTWKVSGAQNHQITIIIFYHFIEKPGRGRDIMT